MRFGSTSRFPEGKSRRGYLPAAEVRTDDELAEETDDATGQAVDPRALILSPGELDELRRFVDRLKAMTAHDAKLDTLLRDIDHARMTGQPIIVFTQYTDTLNHLRDRLIASYGPELATLHRRRRPLVRQTQRPGVHHQAGARRGGALREGHGAAVHRRR